MREGTRNRREIPIIEVRKGAVIDPTGLYRYSLWREWNPDAAQITFIMLNPSRADATNDDPTIRRCINFASSWGYGYLEVVNLFAYRTSHPQQFKKSEVRSQKSEVSISGGLKPATNCRPPNF